VTVITIERLSGPNASFAVVGSELNGLAADKPGGRSQGIRCWRKGISTLRVLDNPSIASENSDACFSAARHVFAGWAKPFFAIV
jgi:hypothetical protein